MNWRIRIGKSLRDEIRNGEKTLESVSNLSITLLQNLESIKSRCKNEIEKDDELEYAIDELKDHLEFSRDLSNGTIPKEEWEEYALYGKSDIIELFNSYLNEFWNLCDYQIDSNTKLVWVEL